jgi:hypothetical protein
MNTSKFFYFIADTYLSSFFFTYTIYEKGNTLYLNDDADPLAANHSLGTPTAPTFASPFFRKFLRLALTLAG